jgi:hypothetical protein
MSSAAMIFKLPQFEIKCFSENDWKAISELDFLERLLDNYLIITPVLGQLFDGKEVMIQNCVFRIKST